MESVEGKVVHIYATISDEESDGITSSFVVEGLAARFHVIGEPPFALGDRVRITITKEPADV